ncbi:MAG TPA: histidine ammonia-lyase [Caldisericia bacterium]|nr:histidine ammonia-lyase [Caldisericia bacterium]HPF48813.1 histidine ammonia-lyase [Caldisericia bacterium]HPI84263.1 histidine ammonia-lyase [Caldisericia bacterium]HPQ93441.1 histidine ammonia-lyase [Caldisericia bacterium]HRV74899.1 histidine ammonia-lyase [Caldisericia bacterium]
MSDDYHHTITGSDITIDQLSKLGLPNGRVSLDSEAATRITNYRVGLEKILNSDKAVYGINTGFGSLANVKIDRDKISELQKNLIASHTAGTGEYLPPEIIKSAMVLRVNTFARGNSGIRLRVVELLIDMINHNIIPRVPMYGSVGASGDLALLSAIALCMVSPVDGVQQEVEYFTDNGWATKGHIDALKSINIEPIELQAKEGLALNNGCQVSTSIASFALSNAMKAFNAIMHAFALSSQALLANSSPFDERVHMARPHSGQTIVANSIRALLSDSKLIDSDADKVQDAYSIRCFPQVAGSVYDGLRYAKNVFETEMNSSTDNPLLFESGDDYEPISGGNFHGAPVAHASDFATLLCADLASIAERLIFRLITGDMSKLPSFLTFDPGLSSGFMITQYTAANLVSMCKSLSYPASVDSIPTCENQEDHVSMSSVAAWKLLRVSNALLSVAAIELLVACQAVQMRLQSLGSDNSILSQSSQQTLSTVREFVPFIKSDCPMSGHIRTAEDLIKSNRLDSCIDFK